MILLSPRFWSSGNLREWQALLRFCWLEFVPDPLCVISQLSACQYLNWRPEGASVPYVVSEGWFSWPQLFARPLCSDILKKEWMAWYWLWWWRLLKWQITDPLIRFKTGLLSCEVVSSNEILFSFSHISFNLQQCWEKLFIRATKIWFMASAHGYLKLIRKLWRCITPRVN